MAPLCTTRRAPVLGALLWLASPAASAADYYVSTDGDDGDDGTETEPWRSIQHAAETLGPGDTVYIREGRYNEQVFPQASGTAEAPITYAAYPGESPVIDGEGIEAGDAHDWGGLIYLYEDAHLRFEGLTLESSSAAGFFLDRSEHIAMVGNTTYGTHSSGIGVWYSSGITIADNEVALACDGGFSEFITVAGTTDFEVSGNHLHTSGDTSLGGEGIDIKDGSRRGEVTDNLVVGLDRVPLYIDAYEAGLEDIVVRGNVLMENSQGIAISSEEGGTLSGLVISHNLIVDNAASGIALTNWHVDGPREDIEILHNTVVNNGHDFEWEAGGIVIESDNISGVVVRNNLVSANADYQIAVMSSEGVTVDHNLVDSFRDHEDEVLGDEVVQADPAFSDPDAGDYGLAAGSPAIDAGHPDDAYLDPDGTRADLGAFPFTATDEDDTGASPDDTARGCACTAAASTPPLWWVWIFAWLVAARSRR